jgi:hypothetical protein
MAIVNSGTTDNITELISGTTVANISNDNSEIDVTNTYTGVEF